MTPVARCLRKVDHASAIADATVVECVDEALAELEGAFRRESDKIVALEEVLQQVSRTARTAGTAFGGFVLAAIERRQTALVRATI